MSNMAEESFTSAPGGLIMLQFRSDSPLLQVVAVGVGPVPVVEPQAPEEALLVEDERQASTLVVHLVLLRRVQVHGAAPKEKSGGEKGALEA